MGGDLKRVEGGWKMVEGEQVRVRVRVQVQAASGGRRYLCFSSVEEAMASVGAEPQTVHSGMVAAWPEAALTRLRSEAEGVRGQRESSAEACSEKLGATLGEVVVPWKRKRRRVELKKWKPQETSTALAPAEAWTRCSCLHPHWNL